MKKLVLALMAPALLTGCIFAHIEVPFEIDRDVIATDAAPAAIGPYSQGIEAGPLLFVSGQVPMNPETGEMVTGDIRAQTRQVMENIKAIVEAAGFEMRDVVQCQVFLADLDDYAAMNEVYATYFGDSPPARAAMQVARLPRDVGVEILATAMKTRDLDIDR